MTKAVTLLSVWLSLVSITSFLFPIYSSRLRSLFACSAKEGVPIVGGGEGSLGSQSSTGMKHSYLHHRPQNKTCESEISSE